MEIEEYTENLENHQKEVIHFLHEMITENPGIELKRKFKLPFDYRKSWICYFTILKNGTVEWAFTRGNELSNENGYLKSRGRKQVSSVEFSYVSEIDVAKAKACLQEALLLDEQVPYSVKKP